MGEKTIEYLFVHDGRQWWLKLTEAEQIADYHNIKVKRNNLDFLNACHICDSPGGSVRSGNRINLAFTVKDFRNIATVKGHG